MKKQQLTQILIIGGALGLMACEPIVIQPINPTPNPTPNPGPNPSGSNARFWNDKGRLYGEQDAHAELTENWRRHSMRLTDDRFRADFIEGYTDGYNEHESAHNNSSPQMAIRRSYGEGYDQGKIDNRKGLSRNPSRHNFPSQNASYWTDGYSDGWSGNPSRY